MTEWLKRKVLRASMEQKEKEELEKEKKLKIEMDQLVEDREGKNITSPPKPTELKPEGWSGNEWRSDLHC